MLKNTEIVLPKLNNPDYSRAKNIHEFTVRTLLGDPETVKLDKYKGFVCVVVNIAIKSNFTKANYYLLNELMDKFGDEIRILAFPCDQFGDDPGSLEEITFHAEKNNVKFDIFAKVNVNGDNASDLWKYMKFALKGSKKQGDVMIKSSYTKFIVNRAGIPLERYGPEVGAAQFEEFLTRFL